jgi:TolA-binding protein
VHQDYPQSAFRRSAYYWEESYYRLGQFDKALAAYQQVIQHFPGERLRDYACFQLQMCICGHSAQQMPLHCCVS